MWRFFKIGWLIVFWKRAADLEIYLRSDRQNDHLQQAWLWLYCWSLSSTSCWKSAADDQWSLQLAEAVLATGLLSPAVQLASQWSSTYICDVRGQAHKKHNPRFVRKWNGAGFQWKRWVSKVLRQWKHFRVSKHLPQHSTLSPSEGGFFLWWYFIPYDDHHVVRWSYCHIG